MSRKDLRLVEEEVGGEEAALDGVHGEAELLEHRQSDKSGVPRFTKNDPAGDGLFIDRDVGLADVSLSAPAIGQDERHPAYCRNAQLANDLARDHRERGPCVRQGSYLLGPRAGPGIHHHDLNPHLAHLKRRWPDREGGR